MSTGVTDKELGLNESNGDILFKINSILHNKLDLGDFFGPDSNNNNNNSSVMPDKGGDSRPQHHHLLSNTSSNGEDKVSLDQHHPKKRPAPLTLGDTSRLSDFLGLSSSSPSTSPKHFHAHPIRTTLKCGEFKEFPDVSSPLNKILSSSRDYDDDMIMTSSSPNSLHRLRYGGESSIHHGVVPPSSSSALSCSSSNHFNFNNNHVNPPRLSSTEAGSPTFDEAILMGVSDKWDIGGGVVGRQSPPASGSDGVYGTNSNYSPSHLRGQQHHDSGISDIFKGLGLNESSCSRVGSYCGSTSSVGAGSSSLLDSPPPTASGSSNLGGTSSSSSSSYFTSSRSTSSPPSMPSISEMDPAVAQAVKNIQNLQNLQTLYNYNDNEVGCANSGGTSSSLERAARIHRNGTAIYDASCTWHGTFPQRKDKNIQLSCKVFLGGVPWDITEGALLTTFKPFGPIKIEWPGKDNSSIPRGYLYIIFENEKQVKDLLNACTHDYGNGGSWYYKISSRRMRNKEVQVIPWVISDSNFVRCPSQRLDPKKTVFVGALHGMLTAEGLCSIFHDLFGGVVYAGVDTDKYKYPQGSGRVTFNNHRSYMKAVSAAFIEIKAPKFTKKVQVDPYLEDELCSICGLRQGPYFCRDQACFKYFCRYCWELCHGIEMSHHNPLMRNSKPNNAMRSVPVNLPFAD